MLKKSSPGAPATRAAAMRSGRAGWMKAEEAELTNHQSNASWDYAPASDLPKGRKIVRFTWAYKVKRDGRLKARLCVQG